MANSIILAECFSLKIVPNLEAITLIAWFMNLTNWNCRLISSLHQPLVENKIIEFVETLDEEKVK